MKIVSLLTNGLYFSGPARLTAEALIPAIELLFGLVLAGTPLTKGSRLAGISVFLALASISAFKMMGGFEKCGCFGSLQTPPAVSLSVSVICISILYRFPISPVVEYSSTLLVRDFMTLISLSTLLALSIQFLKPHRRPGEAVHPGDTIVVSGGEMAGKPFPLFPYLSESASLRSGNWQVMFYLDDCPVCRSLLTKLEHSPGNLAIIEAPPFAANPGFTSHATPQRLWLRLDPQYQWIVEPSSQIRLVNGIAMADGN